MSQPSLAVRCLFNGIYGINVGCYFCYENNNNCCSVASTLITYIGCVRCSKSISVPAACKPSKVNIIKRKETNYI